MEQQNEANIIYIKLAVKKKKSVKSDLKILKSEAKVAVYSAK